MTFDPSTASSPARPDKHHVLVLGLCPPAGLLLCYELAVQTDRRGQPIPRLLQQRSQGYQQTLASLIHDVRQSFPIPLVFFFSPYWC